MNFDFRGSPCDYSYENTIIKRMNFILENLDLSENLLILDIGCGHGVYLNEFSKYNNNCVGIDFAKHNFEGNKNHEFIQMLAENLGFKGETFDKIIMIEVIEHLFNDSEALNEINRILKPPGSLVLTAPNKLFPFETHGMKFGTRIVSSHGFGFPILPYLPFNVRQYITNAKVYTPSNIVQLLTNNGFKICKINYLMPSLDKLGNKFPRIRRSLNSIQNYFNIIENSKFKQFSETIIICAEKV